MNNELSQLIKPNQEIVDVLKTLAHVGAILVISIGVICLIGWQLNISDLISFFPNISGMNPMAGIGCITSGGALLLHLLAKDYKNERIKYYGSILLSICTFLLGLLIFSNNLAGTNFHFDQLIFSNKLTGNHMSLNTSFSFIIIGLGLFLLQISINTKIIRIAQGLILIAAMISMFAILGYAYQVLSLYTVASYAPMPLSSALTLSFLCLSILFANANHGWMKIFTRKTASSQMAFRLILITLTLPALLGYLRLVGENMQLYDTQTGIALVIIGNIVLISLIIWINTSVLQKVELENLIIKNQLENKNIKLEIDSQALASKALALEEEYREVTDKLDGKDKLLEIVDESS